MAHFLFGDEKKMIRVDMSEYQDGAVAVDKLIGMPRGIVGSERGGVLTNQLKDHPYSVVLLDEVEKASPSMLNLFLQAFDEGWVTDGRGKRVYLSDAIVIMTSNIGCEHFRKLTNPLGFYSKQVGIEQVEGDVQRELERRFSPEFRNRIDEVVIFSPLSKDEVRQIALQQIEKIERTMSESGRTLSVTPAALEEIVAEGYSLAYGARFLKRVIDSRIKLPVSQRWTAGPLVRGRRARGSRGDRGGRSGGRLPGAGGDGVTRTISPGPAVRSGSPWRPIPRSSSSGPEAAHRTPGLKAGPTDASSQTPAAAQTAVPPVRSDTRAAPARASP